MRLSTKLKTYLGSALMACLLAACAANDYPPDWPKPVDSWFARKGACPDLQGDFDSVRTELRWLLRAELGQTVADRYQHEQRARISQAPGGSWLRVVLSLNERGLRDYREGQLRFNLDDPMPLTTLELKRDIDYQCRSGWLESLHFPEASSSTGVQRKLARFRRDAEQGLIAETVTAVEQTLGVRAGEGVSFGTSDRRQWYRWPKRAVDADARLEAEQSVSLYRYGWQNNVATVPTRFNNYRMQPICLQLRLFGTVSAPHGPELRRTRDDQSPLPPQCPEGWGKFDPGEVLRHSFATTEYGGDQQLIVWFPLEQGEAGRQMILVDDAAKLPLMPSER